MELKRGKLIGCLTLIVGVLMISIGMVIQQEYSLEGINITHIQEFDIKNMAASTNMIMKEINEIDEEKENVLLTEVEMETAPASVIIPPRIEVYNGMTLEEVASQINKSLKNDIYDKGMVIASKSIELGVDPFVAASIILHETGCGQNQCSQLARECYNFGGQKGAGCGAYKRYYSIDEGIEGMISNLYKNYYAMGLNTVEAIGPKYAESDTWVSKINWYVNKLKTA